MTDQRRHATGVARHPDWPWPRLLFALIAPNGRLALVVDADTIDGAWVIATGFGDAADIVERKAQGWRVRPCTVMWMDEDG